MSEIVNLKRHRKRLARAEKEQKAEVNRRQFGRSKAEREQEESQAARAEHHLDGHKRESIGPKSAKRFSDNPMRKPDA